MDKSQANTQLESPIDINMWESHRNRINARNSTFKSLLSSMLSLSLPPMGVVPVVLSPQLTQDSDSGY